jgi:hypothetical protein
MLHTKIPFWLDAPIDLMQLGYILSIKLRICQLCSLVNYVDVCDHNFQIASIIHNLKWHLHCLFLSNGPSKFILKTHSFSLMILAINLVKSDSVHFLATIDLRNALGLLRMCVEHIVKTKQNVCTWKQCYDGFKCIRLQFHII